MDKRFTSIEVLKGVGIIYLIGLHEWVWFFLDLSTHQLSYEQMQGVFPLFGYFGLHVLGFEVPLLAGITYYLALRRKKTSFVVVLKRSLILIGLGYIVNFMCWGASGVSAWDVLHFIGLSMIISYPCLRLFPRGINLLFPVLIGTIALFYSSKFPLSSFSGSYIYEFMIGSKAGEHFWPFCPWYFVFSTGFVVGHALEINKARYFKSLLILGIIFVVSSFWAKAFLPAVTMELWGVPMFKPSPFYVLGIVGTSILIILGLEFLFRSKPGVRLMVEKSFVVLMGRAILWIYLLNTIVGYHLTFGILKKYNPDFNQAIWAYLSVVMTTLLAGYIIAFAINQKRTVDYV
ncbi:MAG: hypothetical protein AB7S78_10115 [Candidatus Omnitrophota bacterium]